MLTPLLIITLIVLVIEIIVGIVGNLFIALSPCDIILVSLSLRFLLYKINKVLTFLWMYLTTASLWFATWLIVFYLVKTANFSQPLFLQMKIYGMVPWLLLGSVLVSSVTSITLLWTLRAIQPCNSTGDHPENNSVADIHLHSPDLFFFFFLFLFCTLQGVSFLLQYLWCLQSYLITCLWGHTKKMQQNIASFRDPKTGAHIDAIKALISFLILYVSSFAAQILLLLLNKVDNYIWTFEICAVMVVAYPSVHSIILILINSKLNEASVRILQCTKCHLRKETS
uniref:Taste receptor type 2 n=1 Tax=Terrapene triunguis TaxID=2587831 RepID=A0A674JSN3_9SAUR